MKENDKFFTWKKFFIGIYGAVKWLFYILSAQSFFTFFNSLDKDKVTAISNLTGAVSILIAALVLTIIPILIEHDKRFLSKCVRR